MYVSFETSAKSSFWGKLKWNWYKLKNAVCQKVLHGYKVKYKSYMLWYFQVKVQPEDLLPQLPKPKDLQPFPTTQAIVYQGHKSYVRSISVDPSGQWLVSGKVTSSFDLWPIGSFNWPFDPLTSYNRPNFTSHCVLRPMGQGHRSYVRSYVRIHRDSGSCQVRSLLWLLT